MSTRPEDRLGTFVSEQSFEDLPEAVVETVTRAFVDTVGVTLAGTDSEAAASAWGPTGTVPADDPVAAVLGAGTAEPEAAALRIGTASHALDYDDLSWEMDGHPSVTLVPPLLSVADEVEASGRDLVEAYVAGFEVNCALAGPISPDHYEAGWHATSTFGTFGATAAVAKLLGLDAETTATALCVAASMPSGLKRNFGSTTKPLHAGLCARSGVTAARLAADGFTADPAAIGGDRGFWDLYGPAERGQFSIGDGLVIADSGINVKAYPCCYFTHTAIAASRDLSADGVDPESIERVDVRASQGAADALHHEDPETGLEAKFSMEYAVASAIATERVGLSTFRDPAIADPTVQRVRERVDFSIDPDLNYDSHVATVRIETETDVVERRQENPPGTHENPLTSEELRAKFEECAETVCAPEEARRLYDALSSLPAHGDVLAVLAGDAA